MLSEGRVGYTYPSFISAMLAPNYLKKGLSNVPLLDLSLILLWLLLVVDLVVVDVHN